MAVEYVTNVQGTSSSSLTRADITLTTRSVGELVFVLIHRTSDAAPYAKPTGWTLIQSHASTYAAFLYAKVLTADDLGLNRWNWESNAKVLANAFIYAGHDSSDPITASGKGEWIADSGTSVDCGSITTSEPLVVAFCASYSTSWRTHNALDGFTERYDYGDTTPDFFYLCADTNNQHGGGTIAPDFTLSGAATYRGGFIVAIAAAARIFVPDLQGGLDTNLTGGI